MSCLGNCDLKYCGLPVKTKSGSAPSPLPAQPPVDKAMPSVPLSFKNLDKSEPSPMPSKPPIGHKNPTVVNLNPMSGIKIPDDKLPTVKDINSKPPEGTFVFFDCFAKAVDKVLEKQAGEKTVVNPQMQGVTAFGGTKEAPQSLFVEDSSTGKINTYIYRKVSPSEIANGRLDTGEKISKEQFQEGKTYYVLVSAGNNQDSIKNDHVEIYSLNYSEKDGVPSYTLEQDEGMDGAGKSSVRFNA